MSSASYGNYQIENRENIEILEQKTAYSLGEVKISKFVKNNFSH